MDLKHSSNLRMILQILVILGLTAAFIIIRPDIDLAISVIDNAWAYPQGDWRVKAASDYLILTKHPKIYDNLGPYFWVCHGNPDLTDYRAEAVARILGNIHTEEALDALQKVITEENYQDGFSYCDRYVWNGLLLQGDEGYEIIQRVAIGNLHRDVHFRQPAIRLLGESGNDRYLTILASLLVNNKDSRVRYSSVIALAKLGTPEAINYIEIAASSDPNEDVRALAAETLAELDIER